MPRNFKWFDYEVPRRLVAQEPLRNRSDARLMLVDRRRQAIEHHHVRDLPRLLTPGDRVMLNDTKVVPAQLVGRRAQTGGQWQGLFLKATPEGHWQILCKTRGRLSAGEAVRLVDREGRPGAALWLIEQLPGGEWLAHPEMEAPPDAVLEQYGRVPLPPYIRGGNMVDADVSNYQTVFARHAGAVAAPTAGLHFNKELLRSLNGHGMTTTAVTLHVGLGTFRPIETEQIADHTMHEEWGEISPPAAAEMNETRLAGGRLVAVGTTVTRLLESAVRAVEGATTESRPAIPAWQGVTDLFIRPPFEFRAVDALMTNFHYPRTTLLVLVQTFAGDELVAAAYDQAVREEYRFYSYGDAMLIL